MYGVTDGKMAKLKCDRETKTVEHIFRSHSANKIDSDDAIIFQSFRCLLHSRKYEEYVERKKSKKKVEVSISHIDSVNLLELWAFIFKIIFNLIRKGLIAYGVWRMQYLFITSILAINWPNAFCSISPKNKQLLLMIIIVVEFEGLCDSYMQDCIAYNCLTKRQKWR